LREESTMNKQTHLATWDEMRLRHGIMLRLLEQIPATGLTSHPIGGMRTPVELVVHIYTSAEQIADSVLTGRLADYDEKPVVASITTREQLLAFVNATWASIDRKARSVSDAQLASLVETPWGKPFPGAAMLGFIHDEYLHHRGQLYAFVRTFGTEPVMVWDFENNAPEFRPQQQLAAKS
jgi:uncharacterized damage-inducible protein DinB